MADCPFWERIVLYRILIVIIGYEMINTAYMYIDVVYHRSVYSFLLSFNNLYFHSHRRDPISFWFAL